MLMSCGRSGAEPETDNSTNVTQGTENEITEVDSRESQFINAIAGV